MEFEFFPQDSSPAVSLKVSTPPGTPERKAEIFARSAAAGFDYKSITLAIDGMDFRAAGHQIAIHRAFVADDRGVGLDDCVPEPNQELHGPGAEVPEGVRVECLRRPIVALLVGDGGAVLDRSE